MHALLPLTLGLLVVLAGCGNSEPDVTPPAAQAVTSVDAQSTAAASAVIGLATDAGLNQLYVGGSLAYFSSARLTDGVFDAPSGLPALELVSALGPPMPATGSGVITTGVAGTYPNPAITSGQLLYNSDVSGLPTATANQGWYHIQLNSDDTAPFTVTDENGSTVRLASGTVSLYVRDWLTPNSIGGNWARTIDVWTTMPATDPLKVMVTSTDGSTRTVSVSGGRHVLHTITQTRSTSTIPATLTTDYFKTVNGDFSHYPVAAGLPSPGNGPQGLDSTGTLRIFSNWLFTTTLADEVVHTFQWNRAATFGLRTQRSAGDLTWKSAALLASPAPAESIYITRDNGEAVGPMTWATLKVTFGVAPDYNQTGQHL